MKKIYTLLIVLASSIISSDLLAQTPGNDYWRYYIWSNNNTVYNTFTPWGCGGPAGGTQCQGDVPNAQNNGYRHEMNWSIPNCGGTSEHFLTRFRMTKALTLANGRAGVYRFYSSSDDRHRFSINDGASWQYNGLCSNADGWTGAYTMNGTYTFRVDHWEFTGGQSQRTILECYTTQIGSLSTNQGCSNSGTVRLTLSSRRGWVEWQQSTNGSSWSTIANSRQAPSNGGSATYDVNPSVGTFYRAYAKNCGRDGGLYSNVVYVNRGTHSGNLTITQNMTLGGTFTVSGNFTVNSGVTVTVRDRCLLRVTANNITVSGTINGNGRGGNGGGGGSRGYYESINGNNCSGGPSTHRGGRYGGGGGSGGNGTYGGGGNTGKNGTSGGHKARSSSCGTWGGICNNNCSGVFGGSAEQCAHNGLAEGGGGGGGGAGGSYGGRGGTGGQGNHGGNWSAISGVPWGGGTTGSDNTVGNTSGYQIGYGAGGGGAGGGGGGSYWGTNGGGGGDGGGGVWLYATNNLSATGSITMRGNNGGNGGHGGKQYNNCSYSCESPRYNRHSCWAAACQGTYDAAGGAGAGGAGGSGGGILLRGDNLVTVTGTLDVRGGNGGNSGLPRASTYSCTNNVRGGAGGGGGRIKIFRNPCAANTISPTAFWNGGSGGVGDNTGYGGGNGTYSPSINVPGFTALNAGSIGNAQTICSGGNPSALTNTASPSGGLSNSYAYQWYQSTSNPSGQSGTGSSPAGGYSSIGSATGSTYDPGSLTQTTYYQRRVRSATNGSCYAWSNVVTVTVNPDPTFTSNPSGETICQGGSHSMSVSATGGINKTYQWQYYNGSSWVNVSNGTPTGASYSNVTSASNFTVSGITAVGDYQYRCRLVDNGNGSGNGCNNINSNSATVTVNADPSITSNPTSGSICVGGSHVMSISATGGINKTYRWKYWNGSSWVNTSNGTPAGAIYSNVTSTSNFTVAGITAVGAYQYRCQVTDNGNGSGNGCNNVASNSATVTVNAEPSITAHPSGATICVGGSHAMSITAINGVNKTYQWVYWNGGSWVNVSNGTPAGASYSNVASANNFTVSGITATGSYLYRCQVTDNGSDCNDPASNSATVIVNSDPAAPSAGKSPNVASACEGTSLTLVGAALGSGGAGSCAIWYNHNGAGWVNTLMPITAAVGANTIAIKTICDGDGCDESSVVTYSWTGIANNTVGAASSTPTLCINTALTNITHATTGATGIGAASGLPSGVTAAWASNTITISGTPTASGTFNYSIPLTGGCGTFNATGTITVTPDNTVGAASSTPTLCINTALTNITHATTGATGIGAASGLPSGVTAAWASNTITISGTPTASGTFNYSIPLTGGCGSVNATGTITVDPDNTVGAASSTPTLCINTALTNITHSTTGAIGIGAASGLPSGVTAAWASNTITISGTPTASGTFNYSIPLIGGCGSVNATGTITVTPDNTVGAASSTPTLCINTALTNITHSTTGATGIGAASGLPSGVTAAWASNTITISGTPTASGTFNYTVPLIGGCGSVNATGTITVDPDNTVGAASSTPTLCINTALTNITHATTGATGIGAASGLPSGVTAAWASNTITISGTPTASGTFNYSIPLTGGCGSFNATGTITVDPDNTVGAASSTPTLCINTALTNITHATTGATGIGAASGLPSGVTAAWASNTITISGTPTASGTFNYSVPLTGGCGSFNATGTITVTPDNTAGAASSTPTLCINTALTNITHSTTGATGIGAASGLPSGVTAAWASNTITISGTPTASGTFNYTVPLIGGCGSVNATGTITVTEDNTVGAASSTPTLCINTALTNITHSTTGATGIGAASGLPSGVTAAWASNTITISGTPTASGTFNYSIPLTGGCGSFNATGTITVDPASVAATSVNGTTPICNGSSTTLSVVGGSLATGATWEWYTGPGGTGTNVGSGTSISPSPASTTTYYVRAEGACNNTADASLEVVVKEQSTVPTSIDGPTASCFGGEIELTVNGGSLSSDDGGEWEWYSGSCGGTSVGSSGTSRTHTVTLAGSTTTTSYYVRAEDDCGTQTGCASISIDVKTPLDLVYLAQDGDAIDGNGLDFRCDLGTWVFYGMTTDQSKLAFAINWDPDLDGGNTTAKANAVPSVTVFNSWDDVDQQWFGAPYTSATYPMRRHWNVTNESLDDEVTVRFYYSPSERTDVITQAQGFATAQSVAYQGFEWFKSDNYNPLTDVSPAGMIGPNVIALAPINSGKNNNIDFVDFTITSFSGGGGAAGAGDGGGGPLPVELISFTAMATGDVIQLDWETAAELNNDHFVVLKSVNGLDFFPIATIDGNGTTNELSEYQYIDEDVVSGVTYYYQLNQIDFDGANEYSDVVSASLGNAINGFSVGEFVPNPANNTTNIDITSPYSGEVELKIFNVLGKEVKVLNTVIEAGVSRIANIDVSDLAKGNYIVNINTGKDEVAKKLSVID